MKKLKIIHQLIVGITIVALLLTICNASTVYKKQTNQLKKKADTITTLDQLFAQGKDETPQNFMRLVVMRLIYGLAAQFGIEERLSGLFNGAFVPPNADDDYSFFGGGSDYDDGDSFLDALDL